MRVRSGPAFGYDQQPSPLDHDSANLDPHTPSFISVDRPGPATAHADPRAQARVRSSPADEQADPALPLLPFLALIQLLAIWPSSAVSQGSRARSLEAISAFGAFEGELHRRLVRSLAEVVRPDARRHPQAGEEFELAAAARRLEPRLPATVERLADFRFGLGTASPAFDRANPIWIQLGIDGEEVRDLLA